MKGDCLTDLRGFGHNVLMVSTLMAGTVEAKSLKGNPMVQRENLNTYEFYSFEFIISLVPSMSKIV